MVESLHQTDQGILKHMIDVLRDPDNGLNFLGLSSLEKRMKILKDNYWIPALSIPNYGFWVNNTNVQGHEYRSAMQASSSELSSEPLNF